MSAPAPEREAEVMRLRNGLAAVIIRAPDSPRRRKARQAEENQRALAEWQHQRKGSEWD